MPHQMSYVVIVLIVVLAIYRRVRRHIGWQVYSSRRMIIRSVIFLIIGVLLLAGGMSNPLVYVSDAIGIILGCVLAYVGLRTTEFREQDGRWLFRSNQWLGIILIVIVLGRIAYRFFVVYNTMGNISATGGTANQYTYNTFTSHPLTAGFIFILIAYYAGFYFFLIRKKNTLSNEIDMESD